MIRDGSFLHKINLKLSKSLSNFVRLLAQSLCILKCRIYSISASQSLNHQTSPQNLILSNPITVIINFLHSTNQEVDFSAWTS